MNVFKKKAKIIATIGPASNSYPMIEKLILSGVNVFRINMSHGEHKTHLENIRRIRKVSKKISKEVAVLLDIQGPKIRLAKIEEIKVNKGDILKFSPTKAEEGVVLVDYEFLCQDAKVGDPILIDDGQVMGHVIENYKDYIVVKFDCPGTLKPRKGLNLPKSNLSVKTFTPKDYKDLLFGLKANVDFVALSFVRTDTDILGVKKILHRLKKNIPVIAKIERPEALDNIEKIVGVSDAIMVARGDMGVEVGTDQVPIMQKKIISLCNQRGVPVITATQMLESMINGPTPTRAEASDVANAVWDGTDLLMLSAETASGSYPLEAVQTMVRIIESAEKIAPPKGRGPKDFEIKSITSSTQYAAAIIAENIGAKYIISVTQMGNSCKKISQFRPKTKVLGVTSSLKIVRRMCLYWGVSPFYFPVNIKNRSIDFLEKQMVKHLVKTDHLKKGDKVVITTGGGTHFTADNSYMVRVDTVKVEDDDAAKEVPEIDKENNNLMRVDFSKGTLMLDQQICGSCTSCVSICPFDIWKVTDDSSKRTFIDTSKVESCLLDQECVEQCPTGAIELWPKTNSV